MDFWSVTRVESGRQTYLYLGENAYGLERGGSHSWEDSFCVRMADGSAPPVAPDAQAVPAYAAAGVNRDIRIGAYAGTRIEEPDGQLFGAICGLKRDRADEQVLRRAEPLLALLGQLLTMVLHADRARDEAERLRLAVEVEADTDPLTGVHSRRAWVRLLTEEEVRFARFADPTAVVMLDLDRVKTVNDTHGHAAGDRYIAAAGAALLGTVRAVDVVARLGGDEFGVLLRGCPESQAEMTVARLREALDDAGVSASCGWAAVTTRSGFADALARADARMYDDKRRSQPHVR